MALIRTGPPGPRRPAPALERPLRGRAPIAYLRLLRLHGARALLQRAGAEGRISDVALDCGFAHLGDFSTAYRHAFGETPSQTRSRAIATVTPGAPGGVSPR